MERPQLFDEPIVARVPPIFGEANLLACGLLGERRYWRMRGMGFLFNKNSQRWIQRARAFASSLRKVSFSCSKACMRFSTSCIPSRISSAV